LLGVRLFLLRAKQPYFKGSPMIKAKGRIRRALGSILIPTAKPLLKGLLSPEA
jgi:hypothetical protein